MRVGRERLYRCPDGDKCQDMVRRMRVLAPHFHPIRQLLRLFYGLRQTYSYLLSPLLEGLCGNYARLKWVSADMCESRVFV